MKFITRCVQCGDQNELGEDDRASIQLYFHKGSPNTLDRMVIYCENCGNKDELGISWPLDIASPNKPVEPTASSDAACPCCGNPHCKNEALSKS